MVLMYNSTKNSSLVSVTLNANKSYTMLHDLDMNSKYNVYMLTAIAYPTQLLDHAQFSLDGRGKQLSHNVRKHTFRHARPVKIQISLLIRAGWSESSLDAD